MAKTATQAATMTAGQVWKNFKNEFKGDVIFPLLDVTLEQLGGLDAYNLRELCEIRNAADGYTGFVYYSQTCDFFAANRRAILELLKAQAEDFGEPGVLSMISNFGYYTNQRNEFNEDITALTLYSDNKDEHDAQTANLMAWYVLEEVANVFQNYINEKNIDTERIIDED